jgi:hypothetical protein
MSKSGSNGAFLLVPIAAALAPVLLLLGASVSTMSADEWILLPMWLPFFALWSLVIGYPIALLHMLLAWPLYRWMRPHWRLRWWVSGLAGGVIGALPVTMLIGAIALAQGRENVPSLGAGEFELPLLFGGAGIVGGLVFWWRLRTGEPEGVSE